MVLIRITLFTYHTYKQELLRNGESGYSRIGILLYPMTMWYYYVLKQIKCNYCQQVAVWFQISIFIVNTADNKLLKRMRLHAWIKL